VILSKDQINRYLRHIIIPEISGPGEKKLLNSKVLIYASAVEEATALIYYLAASGIGFISCHLKNKNGFDDLLEKVKDLNGDIVLELADYKSMVEYKNYGGNQGSLIKVLISNYENLKDSFIDFTNEEGCYEFIPAILVIYSGWKGLLQTINKKEDFEYLFSNSIFLEMFSIEAAQKEKEKEGSLLSSCFLGTLTAIECVKLSLNIGTILNQPLYFNLLCMEFSKLEHMNTKNSIFDFIKDFFSENSSPLDITNTSFTKKLSESKVLVVGTGGLGSPVTFALSSLGVGTIGLVDYDEVEISNLNRQILHSTSKIGMPKVESGKLFINSIAPKVNVITYNTTLNVTNAVDIINDYDIVVDAVDNFPCRYLLNDSCFFADKPLVDAAAVRFHGLIMTILPKKGPCYRCIFPAMANKNGAMSCSEAGVLGPVPGVMGFLQAAEVVKLLLNKGNTLCNRIIYYDALDCDFDTINTKKSVNCDLCGAHPTITALTEYINNCENKKET
jgi:molybdopterin/thiamine biosynthesis adenylyltransferase